MHSRFIFTITLLVSFCGFSLQKDTVAKHFSWLTIKELPDINVEDDEGNTPLLEAIQRYDVLRIKEILKHPQLEVNKYTRSGITPLLYTLSLGYSNIFKLLLHHPSIDINHFDRDGRSLIYLAASSPTSLECLSLLVTNPKININIKNKNGMTAFQGAVKCATLYNQKENLKVLLQHPQLDARK